MFTDTTRALAGRWSASSERSRRGPRKPSRARALLAGAGNFGAEALEARVLMAADPVTQDHPLWLVPRGTAAIDGFASDADWANAYEVFRTQATRDDCAVIVKMMYDDNGLYLLASVQDQTLWADGLGSGSGNRWEVESDDSITFYFDPNGSRDQYFQDTDRAFGVNLGNPTNPINGSGAVRRYKFVKGTGAGGAPDVNPGGVLDTGMSYATVVTGSVNNNADVDTGWVTEMFLPWSALNMSGVPAHGQTMGMNFQMIQDNAGGDRDLTDHRDASDRFLVPHFIDDYVDGVASSYTASQSGIRGPVNYAEVMFIDPRAGERPGPITSVTANNVSPFGARLNFTAPAGTTGGAGHISGYEIRYSTFAINNDGRWVSATPFQNQFVPRLRGMSESLRISELNPSTTYFVAIRAVDGAGNLGDFASVSFTTSALPSVGYKGNVIPSPNGRTLQFENGEPFIPVGDHLGISWQYTRTMYPGLIWDNAHSQFVNFSDGAHTAVESIDDYLDDLAAHGVNTMRTYLELENVHVTGNPGPLPQGTYWIENTPGSYNTSMQQYLTTLLQKAAARGIYIIVSPFDTFSYDEAFGVEGPWATGRGGPLTDINNFFQNPLGTENLATLNIAKNRMQAVINWVNASAFRDHVLGYEFLSEWDSYEWTLHPNGGSEPGRETEMRTRATYIDQLAGLIRNLDPTHMVMNSTIARDPRGPLARLDFLSRNFDMLTPHLYTNGDEEPINNPQANTSIFPAREIGYFTAYWVSNRIDHAPILNGEWGMTRTDWPGGVPVYSSSFTQAEDEALFRTVIWSGFASGQVGTGLRIAADELMFRGMILTDGMRDLQLTFSSVVNSSSLGIDFTNFNFFNLAGRLRASSAAGKSLRTWGISDGSQGVLYVLHDTNVSSGTVADGIITLDGLRADQIVDVEFWSTAPGTTAPLGTISGAYTGTGDGLQIALPTFSEDVVVKFKGRAATGSTQRLVTIDIGSFFVTFAVGPDAQPTARVVDTNTGVANIHDISALSGFRSRVRDMTPFKITDTDVYLGLTDERHHVWLITGNLVSNTWTAQDLTASNGEAGLTGDLTSYQPSWGSIHIAGLDARGHAINYWWAPAEPWWHYTDLTGAFGGPSLTGGLTGYVSGWDGLNLAGLDTDGRVIVYWWAPGIEAINGGDPGKWLAQNMTLDFAGPAIVGQLDAYVTPWGGLNVAGTDVDGQVWSYWWAPGLNPNPNTWRVTNLSETAGFATQLLPGVEVTVSPGDGGINVFGRSVDNHLQMIRWKPGGIWIPTDVTAAVGGAMASDPMSGASAGNRLLLATGGVAGTRTVVIFDFILDTVAWSSQTTTMLFGG